jgi:2-polyprenyl-3-methyl-5-hydroxy-6-metoxy-1,4-benzoquinol methylase
MQQHWEKVYASEASNQVSWYQPHLESSLRLIERATSGDRSASIVDIGGGASTLADDLIKCGYRNITVLDISQGALDIARKHMAGLGEAIEWLRADITESTLPENSYDVWHDRAVFHFLTAPAERAAYVRNVVSAMKPGGHIIISAFGPEGPTQCSGLDVMRYDAATLHAEFGARLHLVESWEESHTTPFGTTQQFLYCHFTLNQ